MSLGPLEIALIFLVILLVFGAKRIPEIARGLGKGIREFKDASNDIKNELTISDTPQQQIRPPAQKPMQATPPAEQQAPASAPQAPTETPSEADPPAEGGQSS
ncbi:MAG: twin-arginine translocase TatA/TatE family subunit [Bacteroidetes bacterium]|nr:twin-arginine translocase TatA/TatE family subunit [Bacteroidota bacterium]